MSKKRGDDEIRRLREQLVAASSAEGSAASELPYDLRWARRVLLGEEAVAPEVLREEVAEALCDELVARTESAILTRLAGDAHRTVAKTARTGLHRLRSHKVSVAMPPPSEAAPRGTGRIEEEIAARGILGSYDTRGQRPIWLATPSARGFLLHQARISSEHGLIGFESYTTTRKKWKALAARLSEMMLVAEVEGELAHWFIEEAARRCQQLQHGLPERFVAASQLLGPPPEREHPALALEPGGGPEELLALLDERSLAAWLPEQRTMERLVLRLNEIATSRIVVDDRQRAAQSSAAIERAIDEYFSEERCQASRRLLLDTAHLLAIVGQPATAAAARAAAELFAGPRAALLAHPLPRALFDRVLSPARDRAGGAPERRSEGGLILPGR